MQIKLVVNGKARKQTRTFSLTKRIYFIQERNIGDYFISRPISNCRRDPTLQSTIPKIHYQ